MDEISCPHCGGGDGHLKTGHTESSSQRSLCKTCHRQYTPDPHPIGYADDVRQQAVCMCVDGINFRRIGRLLGVSHQAVANWGAAHARTLPDTPPTSARAAPTPLAVGELDELYPCEKVKKNPRLRHPSRRPCHALYRQLRRGLRPRAGAGANRGVVDRAPQAAHSYSDQYAAYTNVVYYPAHYEALANKSQTDSVEADTAELRPYLARRGRRSRCFTRSIRALRDAITLFVYAWKRRQLARRAHPKYPGAVRDFVYP